MRRGGVALAGGIGLAQSRPNGLAIFSGDQGIGHAEHTGEPCLDLGEQSKRGFATSRSHPADARSVKIKGLLNPGQGGRQKRGMPPKTEPHHMDGSLGVTAPYPADRCGDISKDLIAGGGVLVAPPFGKIRRFICQLKAGSRSGKQGDG